MSNALLAKTFGVKTRPHLFPPKQREEPNAEHKTPNTAYSINRIVIG
jgi:hypothetical protein